MIQTTVCFPQPIVINQEGCVIQAVNYIPFNVIAVEGQSVIVLDTIPGFVIWLSVNGIVQSILNGDYVVDGSNITLNGTLNEGDIVAGVYV